MRKSAALPLRREIGQWRLACAIPTSHRLAGTPRVVLRDALKERLVVYSPEAPQMAVIDRWLAQYGIQRDVAVEVRSGYAACSMAAAGVGLASSTSCPRARTGWKA